MSPTNWVDKQAISTIYITPEKILQPVRDYFGGVIELDPATQPNNPVGALRFYTEIDNGLIQPWNATKIFINPPFSKELAPFMEKLTLEAQDSTREIIALLPCGARFSTKYWQKWALNYKLRAICFVRGRVKFLRPDGTVAKQNLYDSQIYGYNVDIIKFMNSFGPLGKCTAVDFK